MKRIIEKYNPWHPKMNLPAVIRFYLAFLVVSIGMTRKA
jgi:hypothetical protein